MGRKSKAQKEKEAKEAEEKLQLEQVESEATDNNETNIEEYVDEEEPKVEKTEKELEFERLKDNINNKVDVLKDDDKLKDENRLVKMFFRKDKIIMLWVKKLDFFTCSKITTLIMKKQIQLDEIMEIILPKLPSCLEMHPLSDIKIDLSKTNDPDSYTNPLEYNEVYEILNDVIVLSKVLPGDLDYFPERN